ncbi:MAG: type II toxin-antitoxin system PemK/MazF family toxin [Chitinophagaceae bacterium]|nr:type II toxin-antitoxin system PemK/MazF family toxin [Chitinophagaceae bacterium]MCW5928863.1 type II toxin-antitoxin system PemK/MazF family toxin [Chitinophagaceae bacterium]
MVTRKVSLGQEYIIDLPKQKGACLSGRHHCVIIKRFGSTVQVVPISTNRGNLHYGELPIDVGKINSNKKFKLKVGQLTSVGIENIEKYIGRVNSDILKAIKNFIKKEIVDFIDRKVA